nr:hypothetical protein [bacterium]
MDEQTSAVRPDELEPVSPQAQAMPDCPVTEDTGEPCCQGSPDISILSEQEDDGQIRDTDPASCHVEAIIPVHILPEQAEKFVRRDTVRRISPGLGLIFIGGLALIGYNLLIDRDAPVLYPGILMMLAPVVMLLFIKSVARKNAFELKKRRMTESYKIAQEGLIRVRGDEQKLTPWANIRRVKCAGGMMVFYTTSRQAFLLPMQDWYALPEPHREHAKECLEQHLGLRFPITLPEEKI